MKKVVFVLALTLVLVAMMGLAVQAAPGVPGSQIDKCVGITGQIGHSEGLVPASPPPIAQGVLKTADHPTATTIKDKVAPTLKMRGVDKAQTTTSDSAKLLTPKWAATRTDQVTRYADIGGTTGSVAQAATFIGDKTTSAQLWAFIHGAGTCVPLAITDRGTFVDARGELYAPAVQSESVRSIYQCKYGFDGKDMADSAIRGPAGILTPQAFEAIGSGTRWTSMVDGPVVKSLASVFKAAALKPAA